MLQLAAGAAKVHAGYQSGAGNAATGGGETRGDKAVADTKFKIPYSLREE